jgi:hypothetical protein
VSRAHPPIIAHISICFALSRMVQGEIVRQITAAGANTAETPLQPGGKGPTMAATWLQHGVHGRKSGRMMKER